MRKLSFKGNSSDKSNRYINFLIIILFLFFTSSLVRNIIRYRKVNTIIEEKRQKIEEIKKENEELENRLNEATSQLYIEKQLRDNLGLARKGEIIVVLPEEEILKSLSPKIEEEEHFLPEPNWKLWLKLFI